MPTALRHTPRTQAPDASLLKVLASVPARLAGSFGTASCSVNERGEVLFTHSPHNRGGMGKLPKTRAEALAIINNIVGGDEDLTENDVHIHFLEAASDTFIWDRYMFLGESTLKNIATGAVSGFAFMNSHRTGRMFQSAELPLGRTFCGRYETVTMPAEGDDPDAEGVTKKRVVVGIYMLSGIAPNGANSVDTDTMHRMIEAKTVFDASVGIGGGKLTCDICGNGIWDYDPDTYSWLCPHAPGSTYKMTAEQIEAQKARGVSDGACTTTYHDAYPGEVSAVYDGAIAGAGFAKAALLIDSGDADESLLVEIGAAYGSTLDEFATSFGPEGDALSPAVHDLIRRVKSAGQGSRQQHTQYDSAATRGSGETMSWKDKIKAAFSKAVDEVDEEPGTTPAPAPPTPPADFSALVSAAVAAAVTPLQTQIESLNTQVTASNTAREAAEKAQALAAATARIDAAKRDFRITPAAAKDMLELAEKSPDAFNLAMSAFEKNGKIVALANLPEGMGDSVSPDSLPSSDAADLAKQMADLTTAYQKQHKVSYTDAAKAVSAANPELAHAYAAAMREG